MEKILLWLFGVLLAAAWLWIYRWAEHDPMHQGALVLATILTAAGACKCGKDSTGGEK
ncbi:MAG TPA: hypothetical protein VK533_09655 [Sphingomonas sp.]|uniref:hypothetical protein n=1 Tax=Sphingomonas sp. TaxID=28214 RepID=UPI002B618ABA|nr:hypothetical protein [Sphingomonas sp.]HMI19798.1 hypothetical protein [Sphingomonas sp.]